MSVTFHRAFDVARDADEALDILGARSQRFDAVAVWPWLADDATVDMIGILRRCNSPVRIVAITSLTPAELGRGIAVVLRAVLLDLDRAHERGDPAGDLPVEPPLQAVQQARAVGVAAAGRVVDCGRRYRRDVDAMAARVDAGSLATSGHDECLDALGDVAG